MEVHQLIPNFVPGDAMSQAAVAWQRVLRHLGAWGEVYAGEIARGYESLARPAAELRPSKDALVLYHHGIASPLAGQLMHLGCRRGVVFHNITPARFYAGTRLEEALVAGRAQLAALAASCELSIGVSRFNAAELEAAGHRNVHVVPLFVEPERFDAEQADLVLLRALRSQGSPIVLSVSRVVPHKRVEDLLSLHAELLQLSPEAKLLVVGGYAGGHRSFQRLRERAEALGGVTFFGRVSHAELVATYHAADVYVSMSEHEGFGVPLVEAMAADLPVLAFGAAAVPETMGGRGIVFDEKHFAALAELVMLLQQDGAMREKLLEGQRARLEDFGLETTRGTLSRALATVGHTPRFKRPSRRKRPSLAIVVQRYGEQIVGGAEAHARQVAQQLAPHASVEVLTTCAKDHLTWANELPAGEERDGRVTVRRFATTRARRMRAFNDLSDTVFGRGNDALTEAHWLAEQGPLVPGLHRALVERRDDWDAVVFFTYLYAPTAWGVPQVADRALVVPTAHAEPPLAFHAFADVFELPRALLCNTPEEENLIRQRFPLAAPSRVVGVGIDAPPTRPDRFREKYGLRGPYLFYVGRLEAGKGVPELLKLHAQLVKSFHDAPMLVLAGAGDLKPRGERVRVLGRIDEADKWDGLAGATAAVVPSRFESLSLLTLEAMAVGTPVVGNGESDVIEGQIRRSGAGATYLTREAFVEAVRAVGEQRKVMSARAKKYAARHRWSTVVEAYLDEIERIRKGHR